MHTSTTVGRVRFRGWYTGLFAVILGGVLASPAGAALISTDAGVTVLGYYNYWGSASALHDGNTADVAAYNATGNGEYLGYDFGGMATVESVKVYQTALDTRHYVSSWRVWYQGGYEDFAGDISGITTLTLSAPVTTGFVTVQALASSGGDANKAIAEIEVYGTAASTVRSDLAAGQSWSSLSFNTTWFGPATLTSFALFGAPGNNPPAAWNPSLGIGNNYIQIDLGSAQSLGGLGLMQAVGNRNTAADVQVQLSDDAGFGAYSSQDLTLNNATYLQKDFAPVSARYVRLVVKTTHANGDSNWAIARVQVFSGPPSPPDTTPPVWASLYPKADSATVGGFTVRGKIDEDGTNYYVVVDSGATAPSTNDVRNGTAAGGGVARAHGHFALAANTEGTVVVSGLDAGTTYDVYCVAEDRAANLQADVATVSMTTAASDSTPPNWASSYPKADSATSVGFTVRVKIDEAGMAYYVVVPGGATAPSRDEVVAGTAAGGGAAEAYGNVTLSANTEGTAALGGLSASTTYDVYCVAQDNVPNLQAAVTNVEVRTLAWMISTGMNVTVLGSYNSSGNASALCDGNTTAVAAYHATANDEYLGYDFGGMATVESVKVYQTALDTRHYVSTWRVWYQGGYEDFTGDSSGISTLTLSAPTQTGFVSVQARTSSGGDANKAIAEIEVYGTAPTSTRTDLAAGQTWSDSNWGHDFGTPLYTTRSLFSANNTTGGWKPTLGVGNNYIQIDLGSETSIGGLGVLGISDGPSIRDHLQEVQLQFSTDPSFGSYGSQDVTLQNTTCDQVAFIPVLVRYVRLVAKTVYANADSFWGLARIQVFSGSPAGRPAGTVFVIR